MSSLEFIDYEKREKHFCWLPVKLINGKLAWLKSVTKITYLVKDDTGLLSNTFNFFGFGKLNKQVFVFEELNKEVQGE